MALLRGNSASRELELALKMEEGRKFAFGRTRDMLRPNDADEEEDEVDAICVEAAAAAPKSKLDGADDKSAEVAGACKETPAATAAVRAAMDESGGGECR